MNKQIDVYSSGDYAGVYIGGYSFYYGYEETDPITEEWCFHVTFEDKEIARFTTSQLDAVASTDKTPQSYLLAGMSLWISTLGEHLSKLFVEP